MTEDELGIMVCRQHQTIVAVCEKCKLKEKYEKQKEINKELVDENEALKFAARMSEKIEKQLRAEIEEFKETNHELAELAIARNKRIAELEKENAELRGIKDVTTLIRANNDTVVTLMQLNNKLVSKSQQLTKATKLLNEFMRISKASDEDFEHDYSELIGETEQFLKEIEK